MTTVSSFARVSLAVLIVAASAAACATATPTVSLRRTEAPRGVVTRLADLQIAPGADTVIALSDGSMLRGRFQSVSADALSIATKAPDQAPATRSVTEADIVSAGRVVGTSRRQRERIGVGIGVLASLPLSVSRVRDASLIGGSLGALVGRHTGDQHVEIVLKGNPAP